MTTPRRRSSTLLRVQTPRLRLLGTWRRVCETRAAAQGKRRDERSRGDRGDRYGQHGYSLGTDTACVFTSTGEPMDAAGLSPFRVTVTTKSATRASGVLLGQVAFSRLLDFSPKRAGFFGRRVCLASLNCAASRATSSLERPSLHGEPVQQQGEQRYHDEARGGGER